MPLTLRPPHFRPDLAELESKITGKTRLLLLNSPHNPTGMVLTRAETEAIARIAIEHDLLVITDEAYEHLTFDVPHVPFATIDGMRGRVVSIGSAGKTFSFTGWKVGWATATPDLVDAVRTTKQFLTYVSGGPFQYAVAEALDLPDSYYTEHGRRPEGQARPDGRGPAARSASRSTSPTAPTSSPPTSRRWASSDAMEFCLRPARPGRRGGDPERRLLRRPPGRGPHHGPLRVLQAPGGAQGGAQPAVRPRPLTQKSSQPMIPNGCG